MIEYREGYKYQLAEDYTVTVDIYPNQVIMTPFIILTTLGVLLVKERYAWDGSSGPTIDSSKCMEASLIHDALYQLMRMDLLDIKWRGAADLEYKAMCLKGGMSKLQAWWRYCAIKKFAAFAADPRNIKEVIKV